MRACLNAIALGLCCATSGCALDPFHMLGFDGNDAGHFWHELPGQAGLYAVGVPLGIVCLPLMLLERACGWGGLLSGARAAESRDGVSTYLVGVPAITAGYILATPFFVLGLPWEFGSSSKTHEKPMEPEKTEGPDR